MSTARIIDVDRRSASADTGFVAWVLQISTGGRPLVIRLPDLSEDQLTELGGALPPKVTLKQSDGDDYSAAGGPQSIDEQTKIVSRITMQKIALLRITEELETKRLELVKLDLVLTERKKQASDFAGAVSEVIELVRNRSKK